MGGLPLSVIDADAAIADASELCEIADGLGIPVWQASAAFGLGQALALAGDRAAAERHLDRAAELARGTVIHVQISVSLLRGMLDADERPDAAMASLRDAIDVGERHAVMPDILANAYEAVAAIWLDEGRLEDAAVLLGAVDEVRAVIGAHGDHFGAERRARVRSAIAAALSPPALDALTSRGRAMTRDEVRRFALGEDGTMATGRQEAVAGSTVAP
jgi:hypothetical protein